MSDGHADFLLARIAEDEAVAEAAGGAEVRWGVEHFATLPPCYGAIAQMKGGKFDRVLVVPAERHGDHPGTEHPEAMQHMGRHDPARVLAECEAKKRIVAWVTDPYWETQDEVLRDLTIPYADHPDCKKEWLVDGSQCNR